MATLGLMGTASRLAGFRTVDELIDTSQPLLEANADHLERLTDAQTGQRGFRLSGEPRFLQPFMDALADVPALQLRLRNLAERYPPVAPLVEEEIRLARIWFDDYAVPLVDRLRFDPSQQVDDRTTTEGIAQFEEFRQANERTRQALRARRAALQSSLRASTVASIIATFVVLVAGLLTVMILARRTTRYISDPLEDMRRTVLALAAGDLSARSDPRGPVETRELAIALNELAGSRQLHEEMQSETLRRMEELDRTRADFVASVSHELRTPLTSVTGYAEMLADGEAGELNAQQAKMVETIDRNARRLLALVEDLLIASRIEAGVLAMLKAPVDMTAVIEAAVTAVRPAVAGKLELEVELPPSLGPIHGDREKLERVILNLLSNAVKFTPEGGRVTLRAREEPGRLRIEVSDTGIGIPEAEQPRLFERFFRSSTAKQAVIAGTGLGLTIVQSIVEAHDGDITFTSTPGTGTTFVVELPVGGVRPTGQTVEP